MKTDISNIDLNLLGIFDVLMIHRNVTKAAESVQLSQSAMSHALNRLRVLLDDPVLVKTESGMTPSPRAMALELPIREILTDIRHHLYAPAHFNPQRDERTFVVYSTEYFECVYLPMLIAKFEKQAPMVRVKLGILTQDFPEKEMINGDVNFVVGVENISEIPNRMNCQPWVSDTLTCLVRKQNPAIGNRIGLKEYTEANHIYHTMLGTPFSYLPLDRWFQEHGVQRKLVVTTTGYLSAAMIVSETDYVLTLPYRLARKLVTNMNLRIVDPPEEFLDYKLNLIWHPLYEKDPGCLWFRSQLLELVPKPIDSPA
jgi:DNA-binding transcriptional LysR family regulator